LGIERQKLKEKTVVKTRDNKIYEVKAELILQKMDVVRFLEISKTCKKRNSRTVRYIQEKEKSD